MTLEKTGRKKNTWCIFLCIIILATHISCVDNKKKTKKNVDEVDLLEMIYTIADEQNMLVISDINLSGGDLYGKSTTDELIKKGNLYIEQYNEQYGNHPSFWGWYLNNEINPIENSDHEQSSFWRTVWKSIVYKCHTVKPNSKVTISPFFLLDKKSWRGFKYLPPSEYEEWWYNTMKEAGIDILMLQDSGAEHLSFFTLEDRKPFFRAFANACERAGKEFWLNVETGQVKARDWRHALNMEKEHNKEWAFTGISWLIQKINLAAEYATGLVNWGYYPLMNPVENTAVTLVDIDGQSVDLSQRKTSYIAYKNYVKNISDIIPEGKFTQPKLNGTLWFLPVDVKHLSKSELGKAVKLEIKNQKEIGFNLLWLCNTPSYFNGATVNN
jgi:hypothetical protein